MEQFEAWLKAVAPGLWAWIDRLPVWAEVLVIAAIRALMAFAVVIGLTGFSLVITHNGPGGQLPIFYYGLRIAFGIAALNAAIEIVTHRRTLGFRGRLWAWKIVTFTLWLLGFLVIAGTDWTNIQGVWRLGDFLLTNPRAKDNAWNVIVLFLADGYDNPKSSVFFHSWLAFWTVLALLKLGDLGNRPRNWQDFRRFRSVFLCTLACAGYPGATAIYRVLDGLDPADWLTVLRIIAPPVLLPFVGLATLLAIGLVFVIITWLFRFLLITLPLMVFDQLRQREVEAHIREQKKQGIAGYLESFHHWLRGDGPPNVPDDSKGARLAAAAEIAAVRAEANSPVAMSFGHAEGTPLLIDTDKHVLVMASTRSGKGVTIIIPHLLRYQGSAFVLDPKGENARATGRRRMALNSYVHYLDPFGISGKPKSRFNPLAHFTAANMEAQSKSLAAALILEASRDHWTASAQQLLAALILYVVASPSLPPAKKDLVTVRKLLLASVKQCLQEMTETDLAEGLVADLASSFLKTPDRELGSIISTAQRETEILDNPAIIACLSATGPGPEVDFSTWHRSTMSVFLCLSAPKFPVFNRWLRLVLTSALDAMTDTLDPPPLPVCFMLDELATLGHLNSIENAIGLAAGYGVQLVNVWQDVAQMRDLYKGRWASFIGNSGIRALFNLDDYETAEYWSKFIGARLMPTTNEQRDIWGLTQGSSGGETMRPLLSPEEFMMRYARDRMLVLKQGHRPVEAERVPYWRDSSLTGLWDDPRRP